MADFAAFLGIDWANDKHDLCLLDATTHTKEFFRLAHKPEVREAFLAQRRTRFPNQAIAVGLARPGFQMDSHHLEMLADTDSLR